MQAICVQRQKNRTKELSFHPACDTAGGNRRSLRGLEKLKDVRNRETDPRRDSSRHGAELLLSTQMNRC